MCGIAGIISKTANHNLPGLIKPMLDVIQHRGPDGEGTYQFNNLILGHRLLSIIDLSENAAQPMHFNNNLVITFNGEIYNYIEIRAELEQKGFRFNSKSDTEVLLAAYQHWGEACVHHFNGMWAFAILDMQNETVFCSRDRFGIKPFYYYQDEQIFAFASEIKQILEVKPLTAVNRNVLLNYLLAGLEEYSNETFFEGIFKLDPGTNLFYDLKTNSSKFKRFYQLQPADISLQDEDALITKTKNLFTDSINLRLRSDVRVGTCLSGGLDSSSISVIAAQLYSQNQNQFRFTGFHGASIEKLSDESKYAAEVANHADFELYITEKNLSDYQNVLQNVIKTQEEPFGSPSVIMQYFVMQEAREQNVTVLLDGQGGDELLLGYERYFVSWLYGQKGFKKVLNFKKAVDNSKLNPKTLLLYYFYFTNFKLRMQRIRKRFGFIDPTVFKWFDKELLQDHVSDFKHFNSLQQKEITRYQLPHLLKYEDKNSMAHSIETRLPFLDYKLVEHFLALPMNLKIRDGWSKYVLRKTIDPDLPQSITWRKNKFGFLAPVNTWLSNHSEIENQIKSSELLKPLLTEKTLPFHDLTVLWRLYNVALWEQTFQMKLS